jgi:hypothetical protein
VSPLFLLLLLVVVVVLLNYAPSNMSSTQLPGRRMFMSTLCQASSVQMKVKRVKAREAHQIFKKRALLTAHLALGGNKKDLSSVQSGQGF